MLHLYVHRNAETAKIMFEKPLKSIGNLTVNMEKIPMSNLDGGGTYFKSHSIKIHPNEIGNARYSYLVTYAPTRFQRLKSVFIDQDLRAHDTSPRKLFGGNQYDVFKDPKETDSRYECIFAGQFFFIKMLYGQVVEYGNNVKDIMIECEHIGFGSLTFLPKEIKPFFIWVTSSAKIGLNATKSAFLCALLGQFYKRSRGKCCLAVDLGQDCKQTVDSLLIKLRDCNESCLPTSSLDFIKHIDSDLLEDSSFSSDLGYIVTFCHLFDSKTVIDRMQMFQRTFANEFDEMAPNVVKRILQLRVKEDKERLINCVIMLSPNVPSLWKLSRFLESEKAMIGQADAIADRFKFFSTGHKKLDVFDKSVWHDAPSSLRGRIADPFANELKRRVEYPGTKLDEESLINLILDRDLQSGASAVLMDIMKILSKSRSHLDAVCKILSSHNFMSFWTKSKEKDKEDVVCSLASSKLKSSTYMVSMRKDEVVKGFRVLEELFQIVCLSKHEDLLAKCICQEMQRRGLKSIVDAYDEIQRSVGTVGKEWYLKMLVNTVSIEQARPDVKSKLIDSIFPPSDLGTLSIDG